jgi:hypothetical protein
MQLLKLCEINIKIPSLIFTLYAIYSLFVDFKFFENIPQKGALLFPIIYLFLVYNYLIQQEDRKWKHYHDLDDHFLSCNLLLDYEKNPLTCIELNWIELNGSQVSRKKTVTKNPEIHGGGTRHGNKRN